MGKRYLLKKKLVPRGARYMNTTIERPCTPADSLRQSLKEMNSIRRGQAPKRNLDDFLNQLEREISAEK